MGVGMGEGSTYSEHRWYLALDEHLEWSPRHLRNLVTSLSSVKVSYEYLCNKSRLFQNARSAKSSIFSCVMLETLRDFLGAVLLKLVAMLNFHSKNCIENSGCVIVHV
jgi:hypothetical protein